MDILCSDKTGTLTKNELKLGSPVIFKASNAQDLILGRVRWRRATEGGDGIDEAVIKGLSDHLRAEGLSNHSFHTFRSCQQAN